MYFQNKVCVHYSLKWNIIVEAEKYWESFRRACAKETAITRLRPGHKQRLKTTDIQIVSAPRRKA